MDRGGYCIQLNPHPCDIAPTPSYDVPPRIRMVGLIVVFWLMPRFQRRRCCQNQPQFLYFLPNKSKPKPDGPPAIALLHQKTLREECNALRAVHEDGLRLCPPRRRAGRAGMIGRAAMIRLRRSPNYWCLIGLLVKKNTPKLLMMQLLPCGINIMAQTARRGHRFDRYCHYWMMPRVFPSSLCGFVRCTAIFTPRAAKFRLRSGMH